jgi:hypothetical protein
MAHQLHLAAAGDGPGQHGIELHHPAVLRRAVISVFELAVGVLEQGLQFLLVVWRGGGVAGPANPGEIVA